MNTQTNAIRESRVESPAVAAIPASQRMYWLMRREVWENRSIYLAPLAIAALYLFGFLVSLFYLPQKMRDAAALSPMQQHHVIAQPFFFAAGVMMLTSLAVGVFYCLDALHGERRDRSILFWKSLPVSDFSTVLSKMITPLVILPLVCFGVTTVLQWIMLLLSSAVLLASRVSVAPLWTHAALFQGWPLLLYHLVTVHGIWYAPIYGWLLLASAWARRAPFLWASLPLLAIVAVEKIAFNTSHFGNLLMNRALGGPGGDNFMSGIFSMDPLMHFASDPFLISPSLWIGLAIAAAFLAAAVRVRRYQGPI